MVRECGCAFDGHIVASGQDLFPVVPRWIADWRLYQPERARDIVCADKKRIFMVRQIVFDVLYTAENGLNSATGVSAGVAHFGRE